jgi:Type VI secretion system/phage-baseplate injector OB domain
MKDDKATDLRFYGKYRGVVNNTLDPTKSGKIEVTVPSVHQSSAVWAAPCVPYAADGMGFFFIPPVGTAVWVEFEAGDRAKPIWTGFEWGQGKAPSALVDDMVLATPSGTIRFHARKTGGEIVIETPGGLSVILRDGTVTLTASGGATVEMQGGKTAINGAALEVM